MLRIRNLHCIGKGGSLIAYRTKDDDLKIIVWDTVSLGVHSTPDRMLLLLSKSYHLKLLRHISKAAGK